MVPESQRITSFQNPKIKLIKKLRDKRHRERENRFVVDSERDLARALDCGYQVDYVLHVPGKATWPFALSPQVLYEVTPDILEKAAYRENPSTLVAVMVSKPALVLNQLQSAQNALILVLVGLQKPGNIGALLRTADAVGVGAVILADSTLDLYNPNIIRASTGACFVDNVYASDSLTAITFLQANGYRITATLVDGDTDLFKADFTGRVALVMGTEDVGLDAKWSSVADMRLTIPMIGQMTDSLNVSVSGAVCLYEALRQRRDKL